MTKSNNNLRFVLICLIFFTIGALLRIQSGRLVWPQPAQAKTIPVIQELDAAAAAELQETVLNFYHLVDKGHYEEAYHLSVENKWQQLEDETYTPVGLTSQAEFVEVLSDEIGTNGMGLNIINIEVLGQAPLSPEQRTSSAHPELQTLNFLPKNTDLQSVYQVEVGGVLLGACARWDWSDTVLVAQIQGDTEWQLLLPGSPNPRKPHHEEWFLDRNPLKGQPVTLQHPQEDSE